MFKRFFSTVTVDTSPSNCYTEHFIRWNNEKANVFLYNIHIDSVNTLYNTLGNLNFEDVDSSVIDEAVGNICNIFVASAKTTFGVFPRNSRVKFVKKPWFTRECDSARTIYRRAKRLYKKYGSEIF